MCIFKGKTAKIIAFASIAVIAIASCVLPESLPPAGIDYSYAWSNGGSSLTSMQKKNISPAPDFSSYKKFTLNVKGRKTGRGSGIGTHDLFLEQAIAQAIRSGADVSWIDVPTIQKACAEPDYYPSIENKYPLGGNYFGYKKGGTAPSAIGIIYVEAVKAMNKGDTKKASKNLGWIAHYLCDLTNPFHVKHYRETKIPLSRWPAMHVAIENDLDYYMKNSVGNIPGKWPASLKKALPYNTKLKKLYDSSLPTVQDPVEDPDEEPVEESDEEPGEEPGEKPEPIIIKGKTPTPQQVRAAWFGGNVKKQKADTKSVRQQTINLANYVRNKTATPIFNGWAKTWTGNYNTSASKTKIRKSGTKALMKNAPKSLGKGADIFARILISFSDPATRNNGIDHISKPKIKVTKIKLPKKEKKKFRSYKADFQIKSKKGKALYEFPVFITWKNKKGEIIKGQRLWTDKKGKVSSSIKIKAPKKNSYLKVTVKAPTSDHKNVTKKIKVKKKKTGKAKSKS